MFSETDGQRNFTLREETGEETSVFSGTTPRQAALKAARRLAPAGSEADADRSELRLCERGTDRLHIYEAWPWGEDAPEDGLEWLSGAITAANVSKQRVEHLDD